MNPNLLTAPQNRNNLIAGVGALVAVIAFFLPFVTISYSGSSYLGAYSISASGSQAGGILWLFELLLLAVGIASALLIFRPGNPFGLTTMPLATQVRVASISFIAVGGLSLLITFINMMNASSYTGALSVTGINVSWGFGVILFLLGCAAVIAGGVLQVMNKSVGAGVGYAPYQGNPYAPGQQPQYPPSGYPGGYQQTPPQQTPYPPTQYPPQQPQYPPQQQPPQYPQQ